MIYITMPKKARVDMTYMDEFNKIQPLLVKHGYFITYFGGKTVSFYRIADKDKNDCVPIDSRHHMDRKDFHVLLELIRRLDYAETYASEMLRKSLMRPGY